VIESLFQRNETRDFFKNIRKQKIPRLTGDSFTKSKNKLRQSLQLWAQQREFLHLRLKRIVQNSLKMNRQDFELFY
jgi:hypothetical protein